MSLMKNAWVLLVVASLSGLPVGCGGSNPKVEPQQAELSDIYDIYQHFVKSRQKAPTQMSDLTQKQYEGTSPGAVNSLKQGKYVVIFGVSGKDSSTVIAYEKDAA